MEELKQKNDQKFMEVGTYWFFVMVYKAYDDGGE
jgi:hypothetical protein